MSSLSSTSLPSTFKQLKVAIVGGGIGGLAVGVALRRAGHIGSSSKRASAGGVVSDDIAWHRSRSL